MGRLAACVLAVVLTTTRSLRATAPGALAMRAFISLEGAHLRGLLTVIAPCPLLSKGRPLAQRGVAITGPLLHDWAREITNQLAGRLKGKLSRRGLTLDLSPPMSVIGADLSRTYGPRFASGALVFRCEHGELCSLDHFELLRL